jgi:ankyrin repeat protein
MKAEIDTTKYEMTPLMTSSAKGDVQPVLAILASGVNVNATDNRGGTALMYAAMNKHLDVVKILLEVGASPTQTTNMGLSAIDFAERSKSNDVVRCFNEHMCSHSKKQAGADASNLNLIERLYEKHVTNEVAVVILILPVLLVIFSSGKITSDGLVLGIFLAVALPILWGVAGKRSMVGSALTISFCLLLIILGIL